MPSISLERVNRFVLQKQHLAGDSHIDDVVRIAKDICGLHGTGIKEPYLALFARARNFTREQLDEELFVRRTLGKVRCMRGTLYILPVEIIPVAFAATRTMVEKISRRYAEFRGVSANEYLDVSRAILGLLKGREMTIAQIKAGLGNFRLHLPAVLNLMCDQGLLVRIQSCDNWKSRNYRYAAFREYFRDVDLTRLSESEALVLLLRSYLRSFGPATETDIAWWIGVSRAKVRVALDKIGTEISPLDIAELKGDYIILRADLDVMTGPAAGGHIVNLLPTLDPYLMGYKQRERYLHAEHRDRVFDRSGNVTSTILVDGKVVGVWDFSEKDKPNRMKLYLFDAVSAGLWQEISSQALKLGRFLSGNTVEIRKVTSMTPLTKRTVGAFMSPLKDSQDRI